MATIGVVSIAVQASTEKLAKGLDKSAGMMQSFTSSIGKMGTMAAGAGIAVAAAGAAAAIGLGKMAVDQVGVVDANNELAQSLGVSYEALQQLRFATQMTGSDASALDDGMMKLTRNLGDAALGTGEAVKTLDRLGLSVLELLRISPDQQFLKIAGAISAISEPALRASTAVDLFGRGGTALLNTLSAGPAVLAKFTAGAGATGIALSQIDANKISDAQTALDRVGFVIEGAKSQLALGLAPAVELVANAFADWGSTGNLISTSITAGLKLVGRAVGFVADIAHDLGLAFIAVKSLALKTFAKMIEGSLGFARMIENIVNAIPGIKVNLVSTLTGFADELAAQGQGAVEEFRANIAKPLPSENIKNWFAELDAKSAAAAAELAKSMGGGGALGKMNLAGIGAGVDALTGGLSKQEMAGGAGAPELKLASAMKFGSSDAARTILSNQGLGGGDNGLLAENRKQSEIQQQLLIVMQSVAASMRGGTNPGTVQGGGVGLTSIL